MLPEISLHILDVVQNSIDAHANLIEISIYTDFVNHTLSVTIKDNGCGMSSEQLEQVIDPFYTTRTTRNVGLGIPFFRFAALQTGGSFTISSTPNLETTVIAIFHQSNIDCIPLGDIISTILILITMNESIDFLYTYSNANKSFSLDTRELRLTLGNIPFSTPEIKDFIKCYLYEHQLEVDS